MLKESNKNRIQKTSLRDDSRYIHPSICANSHTEDITVIKLFPIFPLYFQLFQVFPTDFLVWRDVPYFLRGSKDILSIFLHVNVPEAQCQSVSQKKIVDTKLERRRNFVLFCYWLASLQFYVKFIKINIKLREIAQEKLTIQIMAEDNDTSAAPLLISKTNQIS